MKKLFLITGATLALGVAGISYAAASAASAPTVGTLPGAYIGVGLGYGGMDTPKITPADLVAWSATHGTSTLYKGVAARGYLGYLWAIPQVQNLQLGAELGYNYYPKNKYTLSAGSVSDAWNYSGYNIDLLGVAKYNFGASGFNVIGKVGPAYVHQKFHNELTGLVIPGLTGNRSKSQIKAEVAAGVGYDINQNIDVNIIYAHVFGNKPPRIGEMVNVTTPAQILDRMSGKIASVDTVMLTAAYHFGNLGGIV